MNASALAFFLASTTLIAGGTADVDDEDPVEVELGDGTVDGSFLQPGTTEWVMFERTADGAETMVGTWTDQLEFLKRDGRKILRRTQSTYDAGGAWKSSQVHTVEADTLAPIRDHYTARDAAGHTEYRGNEAAGTLLTGPDAEPTAFVGAVDRPVFDFNLAGLLLVAFPLADGYAATFPYFELRPSFAPGTLRVNAIDVHVARASFRVTDVETVTVAGETREAFVVETGSDSFRLKFWLSKSSPYILGLESGTSAKTTIWRLRTTR